MNSKINEEPLGILSKLLGFAREVILSIVFSHFNSDPRTTSSCFSHNLIDSSVGNESLTINLVGYFKLFFLSDDIPKILTAIESSSVDDLPFFPTHFE